MAKEVTFVILTEIDQPDDDWQRWMDGIIDDFADIGHVIEVTQEDV